MRRPKASRAVLPVDDRRRSVEMRKPGGASRAALDDGNGGEASLSAGEEERGEGEEAEEAEAGEEEKEEEEEEEKEEGAVAVGLVVVVVVVVEEEEAEREREWVAVVCTSVLEEEEEEENLDEMLDSHEGRRETGGGASEMLWPVPLAGDGEEVGRGGAGRDRFWVSRVRGVLRWRPFSSGATARTARGSGPGEASNEPGGCDREGKGSSMAG